MTSVNPTANGGTTTREAVDAHGHQEMHEQLLSPLAKNANVRGAINEILNQMQTSAQELTGAKPATPGGGGREPRRFRRRPAYGSGRLAPVAGPRPRR